MAVDLAPTTLADEVIQNVRTILATPKGSVPMTRALGVSAIGLDDPLTAARASVTADYVQAIAAYEPRAQVVSIAFTPDELAGRLTAVVRIKVDGVEVDIAQ